MASIEDDPYLVEPLETSPLVADPTAFSWLNLAVTLLVFLLIFLIALWVIRRLYQSNPRSMSAPWVRVLDRQTLGGQQNLYLVEIAGQLQILGGSDHHLLKICEINDPALASEILEEIATRPAEKMDGWLRNLGKLAPWRLIKRNAFSRELSRSLDGGKK